jgi:SAM-dependent methyltransferase
MEGFLDVYRQRVLGDIFADETPVSLNDPSLAWLEAPSAELLQYARNRRRLPLDENPDDPVNFRQRTNFLSSQIHRFSLTLDAIRRHLPNAPDPILDLGAFPFTLDIAMREHLELHHPILATVNQTIPAEWNAPLEPYQLDLIPVNLDPLIAPALPGLTGKIPLDDSSVGFVIFAHVIEHLYHPLLILREACRVLKPGGKILLSTDNAFLARAFFSFMAPNEYVYEPVDQTAAMVFNAWRGHVRFFSAGDLQKLLETAGFALIETEFREVLYNSFLDEQFVNPTRTLPRWLVDLLTRFPHFRNEVMVVAEKI